MSDKTNPERGERRTLPALALTRAGGNTKPAPPEVYLLADHLDTVLAAAEDIVTARLTWNSARRADQLAISHEKHSNRDDVEEIRKLENTIIIRVLKSRERAEDVARADKRFRQLAKLYVAGTAVLLDAVEECGDSTEIDFATADTVTAYLRSRGLVDPDAPAPAIGEDLEVGEDFLIAKRIAAGPLMDLAAALLDALELHYDLFLDEDELAMAPQINRFDHDDAFAVPTSEVIADVDTTLDAAINEVREDVATQADTSLDAGLWARLNSENAVVLPEIMPPEPEPLVTVSKSKAQPDVDLSANTQNDDSEGDAPATDEISVMSEDTGDDADVEHSAKTDQVGVRTDSADISEEDDIPTDVIGFKSSKESAASEDAGHTKAETKPEDQPDTISPVDEKSDRDGTTDVDETDTVDPARQHEARDGDADSELDQDEDEISTVVVPKAATEAINDDSVELDTADPDTADKAKSADSDNSDAAQKAANDAPRDEDAVIIKADNDDELEKDAPEARSETALDKDAGPIDAQESNNGATPEGDDHKERYDAEASHSAETDTPGDVAAKTGDTKDVAADADGTKTNKKKKSKSLLGRLSLLKS